MIHIKFLSPALMGQPVSVTVTQGKVSRNLSIDAFGKRPADTATPPAPDTGGEIVLPPPPPPPLPPLASTAKMTITARRGTQQIAPEGIAFLAEVSGFDAQKPTDGKVYDPTLHDIHYAWTFGDPGEFTAPENMIPAWRNKNVAYGPFPSHAFTKPGTYRVTCIANERSSGKTATAFLDVTVQDPEAVFTAATTVVCSTSGNFAGAPAHDVANRTTTFDAAIARLAVLKGVGLPTRLLLRAGETFQALKSTFVDSRYRNIYVSSFGSGRATIKAGGGNGIFDLYESLTTSGASISKLAFTGPWDSTTETREAGWGSPDAVGVRVMGGFATVHDCTASGMWQGYHVGSSTGLTAIISDCQSTNWEDYGMYVAGDGVAGYVGVLGCRFAQHRNALMGGNGKSSTDRGNRHGPIRIHGTKYLYIDALDGFSRNAWWIGGTKTIKAPDDQPVIRDHRNSPTNLAFYSRIMGEGGLQQYGNGSASPDGTGEGGFHQPCNTVIDKFYFMGSARSEQHLGLTGSAVTVRNGIVHSPNVGTGLKSRSSALGIGVGAVAQDKMSAAARAEPIKIYNVTIINELDDVQQARNENGSTTWSPVDATLISYDEGMVQIANNVIHRPNFTGGFVGDGPLSNARLGIVPRNLGYEWKAHGSMPARQPLDTSHATPANPWSLWRPQSGSPAIGGATGLVAYDDLLGNVRPAKASRGAVEPA